MLTITALSALWFLPFAIPICIYAAYSDLSQMRIPNTSVVALFVVFAVVGLIALPFDALIMILAASLLAAWLTHRIIRATPFLRNFAPNWKSWHTGKDFPMGLALGATLVLYLALGVAHGS